jgi:large subunit ribosomal protein L22
MQKTFYLNYLRIAPRKVRLVADLIRGKKAIDAMSILNYVKKRAAKDLMKLIKSGITSFAIEKRVPKEYLVIKEIQVNEGPRLKRYLPRAYGRASLILKRSSHIKLVLESLDGYKELTDKEIEELIKKNKKKEKSEKEQKEEKQIREFEQKEQKSKFDIIIPKIFRRKSIDK